MLLTKSPNPARSFLSPNAHRALSGVRGTHRANRLEADPGGPVGRPSPQRLRTAVAQGATRSNPAPLSDRVLPPFQKVQREHQGAWYFTDQRAELRAGSAAWLSGPQACALATQKAPPLSAHCQLELGPGPSPTGTFPQGPSWPPPQKGLSHHTGLSQGTAQAQLYPQGRPFPLWGRTQPTQTSPGPSASWLPREGDGTEGRQEG